MNTWYNRGRHLAGREVDRHPNMTCIKHTAWSWETHVFVSPHSKKGVLSTTTQPSTTTTTTTTTCSPIACIVVFLHKTEKSAKPRRDDVLRDAGTTTSTTTTDEENPPWLGLTTPGAELKRCVAAACLLRRGYTSFHIHNF